MKKILLLIAPLVFLFGCSGEGENLTEKTLTVKYYIENPTVLKEKYAFCKESKERRSETNCMNAFSANAKVKRAKKLGVDPIKLL